ncbi:MAG: DUF4276 family protein [Chloroflexota bacterium]|nr:DUF4276 family protein [Chloroflexota bacterium]
MKQLILALYAEGRTDERFLPVIIQRTADRLLRRHALASVEVMGITSLKADGAASNHAESILSVARQACGFHALVVHADADAPTAKNARQQRFLPGQQLVQASDNHVCRDLLPIIPIRMMESWIMADVAAFQEVVGTNMRGADMGFPAHPQQVESIQNPKHELKMLLNQVFTQRRRRKASLGQYYEPLARHISLEQLDGVPAFQQFVDDLTEMLTDLHFIRVA